MQNRPRGLRVVTAEEVTAGLAVRDAADALHGAFRDRIAVAAPTRTQLPFADGTLLVMPATGDVGAGEPYGGVKLVTVRPDNPRVGAPSVQAVYVLFAGGTLAPVALIDGAALTNLRTSAVSAVATRLLARPDSTRLLLFGAGAQAQAHLAALHAILPLTEVVVVSRSRDRAEGLVARARRLALTARTGRPDDLAGDVAAADVVCACTTSATPLFDGTWLTAGTHVIAVGAYQPTARELDATTVLRGRVVVEDRAAALAEAGELALPIAAGQIAANHIAADLPELCAGARVRRNDEDITVFKSVGLAAEDLVIATALWQALVTPR